MVVLGLAREIKTHSRTQHGIDSPVKPLKEDLDEGPHTLSRCAPFQQIGLILPSLRLRGPKNENAEGLGQDHTLDQG